MMNCRTDFGIEELVADMVYLNGLQILRTPEQLEAESQIPRRRT